MNNYYSMEPLRFIVKFKGNNSTEAYARHCEVISAVIDAARKAGADIDENFYHEDGTRIYFVDEDGEGKQVNGWLEGEDEYPKNNA